MVERLKNSLIFLLSLHLLAVFIVLCESATSVRLRGGGTAWDGRVEILVNKTWGTICDSQWDLNDANVICRQLGYGGAAGYTNSSLYGGRETDVERVWVDEVECRGDENDISDCSRTEWGVVNSRCNDHTNDAGVICSDNSTAALKVRLVGGATETEGLVEIFFGNEWGGVCDDGWGIEESLVVCRELGFSYTSHQPSVGEFGEGLKVIWLDDMLCSGGESRLADCSSAGWGKHNCAPSENAVVRCVLNSTCAVRISTDIDRPWAGVVEVFTNDEWGRVCSEGWGIEEARVTCRQLGYYTALEASGASFQSNLYWLAGVECTGYEDELCQCSSSDGLANSNCNSSSDARIVCSNLTGNPYDLRLVGGVRDWEGRIEVSINGEWGTVCAIGFLSNDFDVICRQLGHQQPLVEYYGASFELGEGKQWFYNFNCSGDEESVFDCQYVGGIGKVHHLCEHRYDASVICQSRNNDPEAGAPLRLIGGSSSFDGQLQVFYNGRWGLVCEEGWSMMAASIACSQLGYGEVLSYNEPNNIEVEPDMPGPVPLWLDDVNCLGNEEFLSSCSHSVWGTHNCPNDRHVGLTCAEPEEDPHRLRLVGGETENSGRLEILYGGVWGTICSTGWDFDDSDVACKQLGFSGALMLLSNQMIPDGSGIVWLENVGCHGNESRLTECDISGWGLSQCNHSMDVSIMCIDLEISSNYSSDLQPSTSPLLLLPISSTSFSSSTSSSSSSSNEYPSSTIIPKYPEVTSTIPSNSTTDEHTMTVTLQTNLQATPTDNDPATSDIVLSQPIVISISSLGAVFLVTVATLITLILCLCTRLKRRRVYKTSSNGKGRESPSLSFSSSPPHTHLGGDEIEDEGRRMAEERLNRYFLSAKNEREHANIVTNRELEDSSTSHVIDTTNYGADNEYSPSVTTNNETFV